MKDKISVFGSSGFIGKRFCEMYSDETLKIPRDCVIPKSKKVLYLISTTHNYNELSLDVETNLLMLSKVLENLDSSHTLSFVSSWFVYPEDASLPVKEDHANLYLPKKNYSLTKRLAEDLLINYCQRQGISWRIFRLANVFGKGDNFSEKKNALQYLTNEIKHDRPITLDGGARFYRDYIHVDDVCNNLSDGLDKLPANEIYNVGSGEKIYLIDLLDMAINIYKSKSTILMTRKWVRNFSMDISKIRGFGLECVSPYVRWIRMLLDEDYH